MKVNKSLTVVVVVMVILAGIAAIIIFNDGGAESPNYGISTNENGRLTIFGNANNDDYIDDRDIEFIKNVIDGKEEAIYFSCYKTYGGDSIRMTFADANCDGVVDENDVEWIQDMVDRKEDMKIYYYDVDNVITSSMYPINKMCIGYKSNYEAVLICGAADRCVGACNQVSDNGAYSKWYEAFSDAEAIGSRFAFDYESFIGLDADAVITGTRAWFDPNMETVCEPLGIDVVRLPFWEDGITVSGIITLGYLLGCETAAYNYAKIADNVLNAISEKTATLSESEKPVVFASYTGTSISTRHNGIGETVEAAGGRFVTSLGYAPGSIDGEGILAINPDYIFFDIYYGFLETFDTTNPSSTLDFVYDMMRNTDGKYLDVTVNTNAYAEGKVHVIGQGTYMGPASYIGVAYMANIIYPDLFNFDVDQLLEEYLSLYHPEYDAESFQGLQYFSLEDINNHYSS